MHTGSKQCADRALESPPGQKMLPLPHDLAHRLGPAFTEEHVAVAEEDVAARGARPVRKTGVSS